MVDKLIKTNKNQKKDYIFAVGRRKEAVARVRLFTQIKSDLVWDQTPVKKGGLYVNGKPVSEFFPGELAEKMYLEPLKIVNSLNKYTFTIQVSGGGNNGQLEAMVFGISRALSKLDPDEFRPLLKKKGFLTRDPRTRERRKVGTGGKARRKKQSPKR